MFSDLGQRSGHVLHLVQANRISAKRAVLIGAAATSIHPNAAQGLNLGLRDVAALARCVGAALARGDDIGGDACLHRYVDKRRADRRKVVRFTDTLATVFTTRLPPVPLLRNALMFALDVNPWAKSWFLRSATGLFALQHD